MSKNITLKTETVKSEQFINSFNAIINNREIVYDSTTKLAVVYDAIAKLVTDTDKEVEEIELPITEKIIINRDARGISAVDVITLSEIIG